jgi:Wax ester synthase-like Acyl-CoA acyltransferase domain
MSYSHSERLSALDTSFLDMEDQFANAHMHVGSVSLFDAAPLRDTDGATDIDKICRLVQAGIHRVPRYQQKLARTPVFGNPVWVGDERLRRIAQLPPLRPRDGQRPQNCRIFAP